MATLSYMVLDSVQYTVLVGAYEPQFSKNERTSLTALGKHDTVYPAQGETHWALVLKVTKAKLDSLKTTWAKKQAVSFTDSLNSTHTVICSGPLREQTLVPMLDGDNALYHVPIVLLKKNV